MPPARYKQNRKKQREFLAAYMLHGNLRQASRDTEIDIDNHYRWLAQDEEYERQYALARDAAHEIARADARVFTKILENHACQLALVGRRRLKFTARGEPVIDPETGKPYVEVEYSERALLKLLEAYCPEKYRNSLQVIQQTGVSIQQVAGDVAAMGGTIPPPAEAVQAAMRAQIVRQIEGGGADGNGHNGNGNGHGKSSEESDG